MGWKACRIMMWMSPILSLAHDPHQREPASGHHTDVTVE